MSTTLPQPAFVIACGGTGGHLYPGVAVGERLLERGAFVTLAISEKEVDQQAVRGEARFEVLTLPAVAFTPARAWRFWRSFRSSYRRALAAFRQRPPAALLSMGGFVGVPAALAARRLKVPILLHEANAVPGRSNRWVARIARRGFVAFPEAARRLPLRTVDWVGMPVRAAFRDLDPGSCRLALGLAGDRPVLLVTGGSQGARGINDAVIAAAPRIAAAVPTVQFVHLTGPADERRVREAYQAAGLRAFVRPFLTEMELALGAADAAVARAGASFAAELGAVGVPAVLIPYPHAAADHQTANALALARAGAACHLAQHEASAERLADAVTPLLLDENRRQAMKGALASWFRPEADLRIADVLLPDPKPEDRRDRLPDPPGRGAVGVGRFGTAGAGVTEDRDRMPVTAGNGGVS